MLLGLQFVYPRTRVDCFHLNWLAGSNASKGTEPSLRVEHAMRITLTLSKVPNEGFTCFLARSDPGLKSFLPLDEFSCFVILRCNSGLAGQLDVTKWCLLFLKPAEVVRVSVRFIRKQIVDLKDIKAIIDLMKKNSVSEFELEKEDFKIRLKRGPNGTVAPVS